MLRLLLILMIIVAPAWKISAQNFDNLLKGLAKMEYDELDSAVIFFSKVLSVDHDIDTYMKRGETYYKLKKYTEAMTDFEKVEAKNHGMASLYIARIFAIENDVNNTIKWLKIHLESDYQEDKSLIRLDEAFASINESKEWKDIWMKDWYSEYELAVESADYFRKNEEYVDAIEEFDKIIEQYPDKAKTYGKRAKVYMSLNDYKSAMRDLTIAIKLDDKNYEFFWNRGMMYKNMKKHKKALEDYNKAIEMNPYNLELLLERGMIMYKMQYFKEAIADISTYLKYYNKNEKAYYNAGVIYNHIEDFENAKKMLDILIKMNSGIADYYIARIGTFEGLNNYTQMLSDCNNALDLDPKNGYIFFKRGIAKLNLKNKDGACKDWSNAVRNGYFDANEYIHTECQ